MKSSIFVSVKVLHRFIAIIITTIPFLFLQCSDDVSGPRITEIISQPGCQGGGLIIKGSGFSVNKNENVVKLNGAQLEVALAFNDELWVIIPEDATTGSITVRVGGHTVTSSVVDIVEPPYFVRFKIDGQSKAFETCDPDNETATICGVGWVPDGNTDSNIRAELSVCTNKETVTASVIESWAGAKMSFTGDVLVARFRYYDKEKQDEFDTDYADSQTGSELNITDVIKEPDAETHFVTYLVKGTFQCTIARYGQDDVALTEGEFAVSFSLDAP